MLKIRLFTDSSHAARTKFIHSSDLHLGKRFGNFSADLPGRLREARHAVLSKLAEHARANGADTILLAGDTSDMRKAGQSDQRRSQGTPRRIVS
ncbi:hypothetical protein WP12_14455 [Sphingomonas sp. SRS2]|nr:hypothetical protein WP12_14455 [Sphingomonas sp. SRS2]